MGHDFDSIFAEHDRKMNNALKGVVVAWILGALLGLGVTGLVVWAVIKVVLHITS